MDNLEFKQIIEINDKNLEIMTNWMYKWWGKKKDILLIVLNVL